MRVICQALHKTARIGRHHPLATSFSACPPEASTCCHPEASTCCHPISITPRASGICSQQVRLVCSGWPLLSAVPDTAGRAPSTTGHAPSTAGHVPSTAGHAPGTAGHVPGTAGRAPSTTGHVPSTTGHVPSTAGHAPGTAGHVPGTAGPAAPQLATDGVFAARSTRDLLRAVAVYQVCAVDRVVDNSLQLLRLGERLLGARLLQRLVSPFYRQFVAGSDRQQLHQVMTSLRGDNIRFMLTSMLEADVGDQVPSEEQLGANLAEALRQLVMVRELSAEEEEPAIQTKFTAHMDVNLLVHASRVFSSSDDRASLVERLADALLTSGQVTVPGLTSAQQTAWNQAMLRLKALGDACARHNVAMYVDGEFTYTNPAISWITLALMVALNGQRPVVRGTYQCYLKATPSVLEQEYSIARQLGVCFGAKLVRGAYLDRERQLAQLEQRPSPVCDSYAETSENYTRAVEFAFRRVAEDGGRTQIMVATHNYDSILHALGLCETLRLRSCDGGGVCFGQVFGMADYLTVPLGRAGHAVYKAVPFGEFTAVMPYLSRRAAESRLVQRGARLERRLLLTELASRLGLRRARATSAAATA